MNDAIARGDWSFDGHGVNCNGERKVDLKPIPMMLDDTFENNQVVRNPNPEHDATGKYIAEALGEAHRLRIDHHKKHLPHLFVEVTPDDLQMHDTLLTVTVKRADGKECRFNVRIDVHGSNPDKVTAVLSSSRRQGQVVKQVAGWWVDWDNI